MNLFRKLLMGGVTILLTCSLTTQAYAKRHYHPLHHYWIPPENHEPINGTFSLNREIDRIITEYNLNSTIGIQIKSMKYGDMLYTKNSYRSFVPASILKIFTAESALLLLGPNYKFPTSFVSDNKQIKNGVLDGNLYLVNSGDPSLTYYDIADLIDALKARHIKQITGNIYIDNTAYDEEKYGPGWVWDDKRFCYAAPISASIINHNCLTFHLKPAKQIGKKAIIELPEVYYTSLKNQVITKSHYAHSCSIRLGEGEHNMLVVNGCLRSGHYTQGVSTVITDIMRYNKTLLSILFRRAGILINGNIIAGTAPDNPTVIAAHESEPLQTLLTDMLKMSDNIIAGSVFKKIGETYTQEPGSWKNGGIAVKQILSQRMGVDTQQMNIIDGSGLSRYNSITPSQMIQVLDYAFHHSTRDEFLSALPVAGVDGTLKHRLRNISWKVRAKTGTMNGVVALAGYAINKNGEPLAFVIIVNGHYGLGWKYRSMEDQIVTALTRYSRSG